MTRRILVTGAASGIGAACVATFASHGDAVVALDRDVMPGESVAAVAVRADVTDQGAVDTAVSQAVDSLGGLDVVVNCAGIGAVGSVTENDDDEWRRVLDVNVVGIVRVARATWEHLRRGDAPAVVNVGSIAGHAGLPLRAAYAASKGAVHALTLAMAADGVADGIRVNAVAPGTADTPWVARLLDVAPNPVAARAQLEQRQPMGRLARPSEVAEAVRYLASPEAAFTTGTVLDIDGGMHGIRLPARATRV